MSKHSKLMPSAELHVIYTVYDWHQTIGRQCFWRVFSLYAWFMMPCMKISWPCRVSISVSLWLLCGSCLPRRWRHPNTNTTWIGPYKCSQWTRPSNGQRVGDDRMARYRWRHADSSLISWVTGIQRQNWVISMHNAIGTCMAVCNAAISRKMTAFCCSNNNNACTAANISSIKYILKDHIKNALCTVYYLIFLLDQ